MALHPDLPTSPYSVLDPAVRWFPAAEEMRETAYEKLLPPLVANVRREVQAWRTAGYQGASQTSKALLQWWFETHHLIEQVEGPQVEFRFYFAQREAVESVIWLYDVRKARDKHDLLRFDASGVDVFDKRAVDKGQVVFHDISFVEASPRYDKKKLAVSIELTDFSVYYTQGASEAAIVALKEGKSEVICEFGRLYKISKSKEGVVSRERLTKHWTDWVDYWAVDFDYLQRKEMIQVPVGTAIGGVANLEGFDPPQGELKLPEFEERWTGGYIFENEWQSFRTRQSRALELTTIVHTYDRPGRYTIAVKVIDIFGNDTMTLVPVNVG